MCLRPPQEKRLLRVPWGGETIIQVMFFWLLAFCFLGCCVMPVALDLLALDPADLTPRLQVHMLQWTHTLLDQKHQQS